MESLRKISNKTFVEFRRIAIACTYDAGIPPFKDAGKFCFGLECSIFSQVIISSLETVESSHFLFLMFYFLKLLHSKNQNAQV